VQSINVLMCVCPQAQGPVVAAQVDVTSAEKRRVIYDTVTLPDIRSKEEKRMSEEIEKERWRVRALLSSGALDVSKARILQLGALQVPPQNGVLWLEQKEVTDEWVEVSAGLVVLGASKPRVGTHSGSSGAQVCDCNWLLFCAMLPQHAVYVI
jgi:hypothetical protein